MNLLIILTVITILMSITTIINSIIVKLKLNYVSIKENQKFNQYANLIISLLSSIILILYIGSFIGLIFGYLPLGVNLLPYDEVAVEYKMKYIYSYMGVSTVLQLAIMIYNYDFIINKYVLPLIAHQFLKNNNDNNSIENN